MAARSRLGFLAGVLLARSLVIVNASLGAPNVHDVDAQPGVVLPSVQFDLANSYYPSDDRAYLLTLDPIFTMPLVTSAPVPGFAQVTWMATGMTETLGSVKYLGGQTLSGYPLEFADATGNEYYPGLVALRGTTHLTDASDLPLGTITNAIVLFFPAPPPALCWVLFLAVTENFARGLAADADRGGDWYTAIQRYRDETLATTSTGQYYVALYAQYSHDMILASIAEADLLARVMRTQDAWGDAMRALVDGSGSGVVVTQDMQDDLNGILDSFAAHGSPALADVVTTERQKLHLDAIAGLTMAEFQNQIETLGGPSAVEAQSWGGLKSLYR